jgi:hypothetical protein
LTFSFYIGYHLHSHGLRGSSRGSQSSCHLTNGHYQINNLIAGAEANLDQSWFKKALLDGLKGSLLPFITKDSLLYSVIEKHVWMNDSKLNGVMSSTYY